MLYIKLSYLINKKIKNNKSTVLDIPTYGSRIQRNKIDSTDITKASSDVIEQSISSIIHDMSHDKPNDNDDRKTRRRDRNR